MLKKFQSLDFWTKLVVVFLWSSPLLGKAAGYAGLALGTMVLFSSRVLWDRWFLGLSRRTDELHSVAWALMISLVYGVAELIYGILQGYPVLIALQIFVFNICPMFMFLGIWVGMRHPETVRKYIRFMAWYSVIYAPIYFLFLRKLNLSLTGLLPGSGLDLLGNPGTGSMTLLGLLAFEPNLLRFLLPIVVLLCLTIANQERADWLSLAISLTLWGKLTKNIGRVFAIAGGLSAVLIIAALVDLKLPPIPGRGGELSARGTISRMAGSISPALAVQLGGDRANAGFYYGTVRWREHWWGAIRSEVYKDDKTAIFGFGYGYPLAHLASTDVERQGTRSPHSIFYFTLAYSGWVGVLIFFWLEICVIRLLWRAYTVTGQTFALTYFLYCLIGSFFGNFMETPQGAIPLYLLCGLVIGPMFLYVSHPVTVEEAEVEVAELV